MNAKQKRKEKRRVKRMLGFFGDLLIDLADTAETESWDFEKLTNELRAEGGKIKDGVSEI